MKKVVQLFLLLSSLIANSQISVTNPGKRVLREITLTGYGYSLAGTYLVWLLVVIMLYPLCKWYDTYKTNYKEKWWQSYL